MLFFFSLSFFSFSSGNSNLADQTNQSSDFHSIASFRIVFSRIRILNPSSLSFSFVFCFCFTLISPVDRRKWSSQSSRERKCQKSPVVLLLSNCDLHNNTHLPFALFWDFGLFGCEQSEIGSLSQLQVWFRLVWALACLLSTDQLVRFLTRELSFFRIWFNLFLFDIAIQNQQDQKTTKQGTRTSSSLCLIAKNLQIVEIWEEILILLSLSFSLSL